MVKSNGIKTILELTATQAKKYFLKEESYCNFDLPTYFKFEGLLKEIDKKFAGSKLSNFYSSAKPNRPRDFENVNHSILNNKDGKYAWRPFQLIHPAIYVNLVNTITTKSNWKHIQDQFKKIHHKFHMIPNTGHLEIWLQRISLQLGKNFNYNERLCNKVINNKINLWNSDWLNNNLNKLINEFDIIDRKTLKSLPEIVETQEVDLFYTKSVYY